MTPNHITMPNGQHLSTSGIGSIDIPTTHHSSFTLSNVYFVPHLSTNLIYVGQLVDNGYSVNFSSSGRVIQNRQTRKVIRTQSKHGRLILLDIGLGSPFVSSSVLLDKLWTIWHRRLGHFTNYRLTSLFRLGCLGPSVNKYMLSSFTNAKCESHYLNKSHALPFPFHYSRATTPFDMIHLDVLGSRMAYKYYATFIDDHCRLTWIYFLGFK